MAPFATTMIALLCFAAAAEQWKELYNKGATALESGDARTAAGYLEKANGLQPNQPRILLALMASYLSSGRTGIAIEKSRQLLSSTAADFDTLLAAGRLLLKYGDFTQAKPVLKAAQQKAPPQVEGEKSAAYFERLFAALASQMQQDSDAIARLERLVTSEPDQPEHYYRLGLMLIKAADFDRCYLLLDQAVRKFPRSPEVRLAYALASYFTGRNELAEKAYKELTRLRPDSDQPYFALGNFYEDLGRDADAVEAFGQAAEKGPRNYLNHYMYGVALFRSQREAEASGALLRALKLNPAHADSHYWLGRIYLRQEEQTKALQEFEQAVKLEPKHLGAYYQLGLLYGRTGQKEKSREAFRMQRQLTEQLHQGIIAARMP